MSLHSKEERLSELSNKRALIKKLEERLFKNSCESNNLIDKTIEQPANKPYLIKRLGKSSERI